MKRAEVLFLAIGGLEASRLEKTEEPCAVRRRPRPRILLIAAVIALALAAGADVDLIAVAKSVGPGPELEPTDADKTEKALDELGDYRITALPAGMTEDGLMGCPLEDGGGWYSYVRRWYFNKKTNQELFFTYESYAGKIKFLGYGFYKGKKGFALRVHVKSKAKMKARVRELTSRRTVNDYEKWKAALKRYVVGWVNYYKLADMGKYLQSIDEWMRRRIRMVFWKKWKRVRTRWRNLLKL